MVNNRKKLYKKRQVKVKKMHGGEFSFGSLFGNNKYKLNTEIKKCNNKDYEDWDIRKERWHDGTYYIYTYKYMKFESSENSYDDYKTYINKLNNLFITLYVNIDKNIKIVNDEYKLINILEENLEFSNNNEEKMMTFNYEIWVNMNKYKIFIRQYIYTNFPLTENESHLEKLKSFENLSQNKYPLIQKNGIEYYKYYLNIDMSNNIYISSDDKKRYLDIMDSYYKYFSVSTVNNILLYTTIIWTLFCEGVDKIIKNDEEEEEEEEAPF